MDRVLIIGVDSIAGRAVAQQLAERCEVTGFWVSRPEFPDGCATSRIDEKLFSEKCETADVLIFCGGASMSSWDSEFGDLTAESAWLKPCIGAARRSGIRFVFVSSDAVFGGPWVFHDDDSQSYSDNDTAKEIQRHEAAVADLDGSLIVRTNIAGLDGEGRSFASRITRRIDSGECEHVDAASYATPISAREFAEILSECIAAGTTGFINIGGAERTTQFRFATMLAAALCCDVEHLMPGGSESGRTKEQSLRCERLRHELNVPPPLLRETVDDVADLFHAESSQSAAA